jgi:signal transduction histidine kinase
MGWRIGWSRQLWLAAVFLIAALGAAAGEPRRVLLLHSFGPYFAPWNDIAGRFREGLLKQSPYAIDLYEASLQTERFEPSQDQEPFLDYLRALFTGRNLDLVVAMGAPAARFLLRNRGRLFPYTALLITGTDERTLTDVPRGINDAVVGSKFSQAEPVDHILQILPETKRIVVIIGDSPIEKFWLGEYRRVLKHLENRVTLEWLNGLSADDMTRRVADLPPRTAIYYAHVHVDGRGVPQESNRVLSRLREVASAPIFGFIDSNLGHGIVGGPLLSTQRFAEESTTVAIEILRGARPGDIRTPAIGLSAPTYDWRELKRWTIREAGLPAGSIIKFRKSTAWERYRWQLIAIFLALVSMAGIISWLLFERRGRRIAEVRSQRKSLEVIHLNRSAEVGALSASFAHELSQPLSAILMSADTVKSVLEEDPSKVERLKQMTEDIRDSGQHAIEVIQHMRKLLKRGNVEPEEFDLREVIADAVRIYSPQALERNIAIRVHQPDHSLIVQADRVQLQQILLNLARNAMDAMKDTPPDQRNITIRLVTLEESKVEVSVTDSGPGIPQDKLDSVFDTFYTTKEQGTGLGLTIVRTILESYDGAIWAERCIDGGAVFRFTLPLVRSLSLGAGAPASMRRD